MPSNTIRTHIVISRRLVEEVDQAIGRRQRSKFFAEAVSEKLARMRRRSVGAGGRWLPRPGGHSRLGNERGSSRVGPFLAEGG